MKKSFIILIVFVLVFTTACGSSSEDSNSYDYAAKSVAPSPSMQFKSTPEGIYDMGAPMMEESESEMQLDSDDDSIYSDGGINEVLANRKIIKHSNFEMETLNYDEDYTTIIELITSSGGYIEYESVYGGQMNRDLYQEMHHAEIMARIPAEKLDGVNNALNNFASVLSSSVSQEDITDSYFDSESRLNALEIQETRLLELLVIAEDIEDIIIIEQKLSEVRYDIERLTATLGRMDSEVAYSYLNIILDEVVQYQPQVSTFSMRINHAFADSYRSITSTAEHMLIYVIAELPTLLINLTVFFLIIFIIYKIFRLFFKKESRLSKKLSKKPKIPFAEQTETVVTEQTENLEAVPPQIPMDEKNNPE